MGNIVSTWEEIELTDAELQIIYGAQGFDDDLMGEAALFLGASGVGTFAITGSFTHNSTDVFGGTITRTQM
jgi:hypothetical protein